MPKQNFNSGLEKEGPHRQGEKGGKGGTIKKQGRSMDPGEKGNNAGLGRSDSEKQAVGKYHFGQGKKGLGAGTRSGGVSGGKKTGGTTRTNKGDDPRGKRAGHR